MDFEAPDGSQISCREVWKDHNGQYSFDYTTISAYIDGIPYVSKSDQRPEDTDVVEALDSIQPVPLDCIQPRMPSEYMFATDINTERHYLKAPSFTYDDCRPGNTFVADCVLNEVSVLERLKNDPHGNLPLYHGCVVQDGRISHICLEQYPYDLWSYMEEGLQPDVQKYGQRINALLDGIEAAIKHLHSLGLAHNDVNPSNVCVDHGGNAVLIDLDSCLPSGEKLLKGVAEVNSLDGGAAISSRENDYRGLHDIGRLLKSSFETNSP